MEINGAVQNKEHITSNKSDKEGKMSVYRVKAPDELSWITESYSVCVKSNKRTRTKFEKPALNPDMDKLLVITAKSVTTYLREAREQAALKDKEDDKATFTLCD